MNRRKFGMTLYLWHVFKNSISSWHFLASRSNLSNFLTFCKALSPYLFLMTSAMDWRDTYLWIHLCERKKSLIILLTNSIFEVISVNFWHILHFDVKGAYWVGGSASYCDFKCGKIQYWSSPLSKYHVLWLSVMNFVLFCVMFSCQKRYFHLKQL